jgi:hypothetical protein
MKHSNELFFPCLEAPRRCLLTSLHASSSQENGHDSDLFVGKKDDHQDDQSKNLSCHRNGSLSISKNFTAWEEWELEPRDDGFALRSVKLNVYLTCKNTNTTSSKDDGETAAEIATCKSFESPEQLWDLEMTTSSEHMGIIVRIRNIASGRSLACNNNDGPYSIPGDTNDQPEASDDGSPPHQEEEDEDETLWRIEFQTGELCFLSNASADRRLRCNVLGQLHVDVNWKGWEVWRFVDVGNYELLITPWTHTTRVLASNWAGHVVTTEDRHGFGTRWRVLKGFGNGVLVQSVETGRYLHVGVENSNKQSSINTVGRPNEKGTEWKLDSANRNVFFMSGRGSDKYLSCNTDGGTQLSNKPSDLEEWRINKASGTDKYEIYSCHFKRYLGVDHRGCLTTANKDRKNDSDLWDIEVSASGGYNIITSSASRHAGRLCYDPDGSGWKIASENHDDWEWDLRPKMPRTISGPQLGAMVGAGVGAVALTVAAPFAFTWGVAAIGFGAEGISAGTMAAGMMSWEAITSGGGVAAGGLVATLQSIGAAGLGVAGTSAAMGGGALVGTAGLKITAAVVGGKDGKAEASAQEPEELEFDDEISRLPLAAWRSW